MPNKAKLHSNHTIVPLCSTAIIIREADNEHLFKYVRINHIKGNEYLENITNSVVCVMNDSRGTH